MGGGWQRVEVLAPDSIATEIHIPWLVDETLLVIYTNDTLVSGSDFSWSDSTRILTIPPSPLRISGTKLVIIYQSAQILEKLEYSIFSAQESDDSNSDQPDSIIYTANPVNTQTSTLFGNWGNVHHRGILTRGIKVDQNSAGITSGMHLELSGRPVPGVTVDALLDDRDLPATADGGSATLSELDRILFKVRTPHLDAELGDWDLDWKTGRFARLNRQLKGGRISGHRNALSAELAAAGGNNTYHSNSFSGRDGDQGPYELTDKYGRSSIIVATGSERVYLDGRLLSRGRNSDYMLDYQFGRITFTPKTIIDSNSRLEVEFEYNDGSYPHYLYAGRVGAGQDDFVIKTSTIVEGLDENNPLAFEWNDTWRESVHRAGDDPLGAVVSGIETVDPGLGDYVWSTSGADSILNFSYPDSTGKPTGNLRVNFSVDLAGGYERVFDDVLLIFYYRWVGQGAGNWSPVRHIPLPDRLSHSDVYTEFKIGRVSVNSEIAISDYDKNVLSEDDDNDNIGIAWNVAGNWGDRTRDKLTASFSTRRIEQKYRPIEKEKEAGYNYLWNISDSLSGSETAVETDIHATPLAGLSFTGNAGLLEQGKQLTSKRFGLQGDWLVKTVRFDSEIAQTITDNNNNGSQTRRSVYNGQFQAEKGFVRPGYSIHYENALHDQSETRTGQDTRYNHDLSLKSSPTENDEVNLNFSYRAIDRKQENVNSIGSDTRILQGGWKKNFRQVGGWGINFLRSLTTSIDPEQDAITATSAILNGMFRPRESPWMAQLDYQLSTGNERTGTKVATYIGEGRGGWKREGDRYVPDPDGDFSMREIVTDTLGRVSRAEINGRVEWKTKRNQSGKKLPKFPLGVSGSSLRFAANIATSESDPWRAFYFDPLTFRSDFLIYSERRINHDLNFLEGHPSGDGRLSLRWNQIQDQATSGGERNNVTSASFRLRRWLIQDLRLIFESHWERNLRQGLTFNDLRSEVLSGGGEASLEFGSGRFRIDSDLNFGYEERHDPTRDISVIERNWKSGLTWKLGHSGSVRLDCQWLRLTSNRKSPGYDLARGWEVGDNFLITLNTDYRFKENLNFTAQYRGRWRGSRTPRHEGLIEMTVTL